MKYTYRRWDIEGYLCSLYTDGFKHSCKYSNEEIKELILNIGLFKFKGYVKAFRTNIDNFSIDDILNLYYRDREISIKMFNLSSRVEIKLKSYLIELVYELVDNPFIYLMKENYLNDYFLNSESTNDWEVKGIHPQQKSEIYQHYRDYYLAKYDFEANKHAYLKDKELIINEEKEIDYPPFHYFIENMTLGSLINMISKLTINGEKILNVLGKRFNIQDSNVFLHYLLRLKELRNRCAHNGRIFNRNYRGVKAFGTHKQYRKTIYEHKLIDVYYTLSYLLENKDTYKSVEKLTEQFIKEFFSECEKNLKEFMINVMSTR